MTPYRSRWNWGPLGDFGGRSLFLSRGGPSCGWIGGLFLTFRRGFAHHAERGFVDILGFFVLARARRHAPT